jgi:hypothetical protein
MKSSISAIALLMFVAGPTLAQSQSPADFVKAFSGNWQVYEQHLAAGAPMCKLALAGTVSGAHLGLTQSGCAAPLAASVSWSIEGSQLVIYDGQDKPIVKLGGNQKRVTGATIVDATPIILERTGGDGTAAALQAAYNASGCYYLGYTQTCAPRAELAEPSPTPDGRLQVHLETNLSAHAEPRGDSDIIGVVKEGSCIAVDTCTMASDGPWCRAKFGTSTGWMRKLTMRQNRWPVVTFANACK